MTANVKGSELINVYSKLVGVECKMIRVDEPLRDI